MVVTCAWISLTCRNKHVNDDKHVTCHCNILWFVIHNYGCDILWENEFCVIYIYMYIYEMLVSMECKKQKKIKFLSLCRGQWPRPSAKKGPLPRALAIALGKDFFEKSWKFLCRGPGSRPSAKVFKKKFKKNYFFAEGRPSVNNFFKKKLCQGPLQ